MQFATEGELLMEDCTVAILFQNESGGTHDTLPDRGETLVVELTSSAPPDPCPAFVGRRDPGDLRVLTYNVLRSGLFKRHAPFGRILRALDPDVVCFQEIEEYNAGQIADRLSIGERVVLFALTMRGFAGQEPTDRSFLFALTFRGTASPGLAYRSFLRRGQRCTTPPLGGKRFGRLTLG